VSFLIPFEVRWNLDDDLLVHPYGTFKQYILKYVVEKVAAELSEAIKNYPEKYASITMDTYPNMEVCNFGIASLRVHRFYKAQIKETILCFDTAFLEIGYNTKGVK
jgi:hypothetical protein